MESIKDISLIDYYEERQQYSKLFGMEKITYFAEKMFDFDDIPSISSKSSSININDEQHLFNILPQIVADILEIGGENLSLVGCSVLELLLQTPIHAKIKDHYLYFHCSLEKANNILEKCLTYLDNSLYNIDSQYYEDRITIYEGDNRRIHFMNKVYNNKNHLLANIGIKLGFNFADRIFTSYSGAIAAATESIILNVNHYTVDDCIACMGKKIAILLPGLLLNPKEHIVSSTRCYSANYGTVLEQKLYRSKDNIYSIMISNINTEIGWTTVIPKLISAKPKPEIDPRTWYGYYYQPMIIGLDNDKFQALMDCRKNIEYINNLPTEIFKHICNYWLQYEVELVRLKY